MTNIIATAEAENRGESYLTQINVDQHDLTADEPIEVGGKDLGPDPMNYLCAALGSCTAITLRMYVQRKGWDVPKINVKVT